MLSMANLLMDAPPPIAVIGRVVSWSNEDQVEREQKVQKQPKPIATWKAKPVKKVIKAPAKRKPKKKAMTVAQAKRQAKVWIRHRCRPQLQPVRDVLTVLLRELVRLEGKA